MSTTDPVSEARDLLSAANGLTDSLDWHVEHGRIWTGSGTQITSMSGSRAWMGDANLIAAAPRLLAALADEVERLRAKPAEAEIEAAAEAITAHSALSHPCEGGERCCDECGEAFGWHGVDRTEEDHRYAMHRARKALAAAREVRSHNRQDTGGGR